MLNFKKFVTLFIRNQIITILLLALVFVYSLLVALIDVLLHNAFPTLPSHIIASLVFLVTCIFVFPLAMSTYDYFNAKG